MLLGGSGAVVLVMLKVDTEIAMGSTTESEAQVLGSSGVVYWVFCDIRTASYSAALNSLMMIWLTFLRFIGWILSALVNNSRLFSPRLTSSSDKRRSLVVGIVDIHADEDFSALTEILRADGRYIDVNKLFEALCQ